jgi:hypothetical protein
MLPYELTLVLVALVGVTGAEVVLLWWFMGWVEQTVRYTRTTRAACRNRPCLLLRL